MEPTTAVDFFGNPIEPGQIIAYPVRRASRMALKKARVVCLDNGKIKAVNPEGREVTISRADRCVIAFRPSQL